MLAPETQNTMAKNMKMKETEEKKKGVEKDTGKINI